MHTGERPHKCTLCPKSFIQSTQLRAHMFHHTGENAFKCSYCDDGFARKNRLNVHIKTMHENPNPVTCAYCNKQFGKKSELKKHLVEHINGKMQLTAGISIFASVSIIQQNIFFSHLQPTNVPFVVRSFRPRNCLKFIRIAFIRKLGPNTNAKYAKKRTAEWTQ